MKFGSIRNSNEQIFLLQQRPCNSQNHDVVMEPRDCQETKSTVSDF